MMNKKFTQITVMIISFLVIGGLVMSLVAPIFFSGSSSSTSTGKVGNNKIQNVQPVKK